MSSQETVKLDVPVIDERHIEQGILVYDGCELLSFWGLNDLNKIPLDDTSLSYMDVEVLDNVYYEFRGYNVSFFAIKACTECPSEKSLRQYEEKSCGKDIRTI